MLVLLSFALVLVATVLLVIGLLSDAGLTLIYISIACSAAAALVLVIAVRMARPKDERRAAAPEPLAPIPEPALASVPSGPPTATMPGVEADDQEWLAGDQDEWDEEEEVAAEDDEFPIADYDSLTVAQIAPLLPRLYSDELDVVEERERQGKARSSILAKIDELRSAGGADAEEELVDEDDTVEDEAVEVEVAVDDDVDWDDDGDDFFPIEDYDSLSVGQIKPLLSQLEDDELEEVRAREVAGANRASILTDIDRRIGPPPAPVRKAAPAKRTAVPSKAPTKRTATVSRPPAKKTAPVRKAAAPARKTATTKKAAPAARAAAPVRKAAPAKRAAAPAKRATPVRKAVPVKKAAAKKAVKKAAKRR